ncbi:hypothetical protein ACQPXB_23880 [Amycolatopsis sp. CA-161197]|uniref:hypothetical protein n=1 Tax=Amycolatopsis sp. CA-161197 TaxID=3239922 RepID=UPI003D8FBD33
MDSAREPYDREAAEQWFRRRGLPSVVRGRPAHLLVRIVPAEVFVVLGLLFTTATSVLDGGSDDEFARRMDQTWFALLYLGVLVAYVVVPSAGAWLAARWVRRRVPARQGTPVALAVAAVFLVLNPIVDAAAPPHDSLPVGVLEQLGLLVVLLVAAFFGGGSILGWALRAAFRQLARLGDLTSRALPLLLLFTVFGFFTTEIWQVTADLTRHRIWLVVGLFSVVAVLFLVSTLSDEVRSLTKVAKPAEPDTLEGTPFASCTDPAPERVPLTKLERANMVLVLLLTQILQTLVLSVLTFVFFVAFGVITVRAPVIKSWVGHDPSPGTLFGIQVPIANELLQVSLFIAAFSALYFAAGAVTDATYRSSFFEPLVRHLGTSLTARDRYLARLPVRG